MHNLLMSYYAVASIIPKSMVRSSMIATGTTDEQMAALREQLPEYMDGHDVVILGNDGEGKIDYIDLSYVSPYAFVIDLFEQPYRHITKRVSLIRARSNRLPVAHGADWRCS